MTSQLNDRPSIWVVIPAYNEGETLLKTVSKLEQLPYSIVIVDDGSSDGAVEQLSGREVHICKHLVNLGQGAALQTGIRYALLQGASCIVTFDADGQHRSSEIESMIAPILAGRWEISLGSRFMTGGVATNIPPFRRFMLKVAVLMTRVSTGLKLTDAHNGFRAFSAYAASKIKIRQNRMAHASEIVSQIAQLGLRYGEVPVTIEYTEYSLAKGQRLSNSLNILWESFTGALRR